MRREDWDRKDRGERKERIGMERREERGERGEERGKRGLGQRVVRIGLGTRDDWDGHKCNIRYSRTFI